MSNHSNIIDDGAKFQIVPNTRKIVVPQSHKVIGTVGDHNSEQLTFQCPKTIDGHEIANCSDKYISWTNAAGGEGSYDITDIESGSENIYFPWKINQGVTDKEGAVSFSVHFEDISASGELLYRWGTTDCKECQILPGRKSRVGGLPIPDGYIKPSGSIEITANGDHDVTQYATAKVRVASSGGTTTPSGTHNITSNGIHNVAQYELVNVAVPIPTYETYDGSVIFDDSEIVFYLSGGATANELTALAGMTWGEWVESEYNTVTLVVSDSVIKPSGAPEYYYVIDNVDNVAVSPTTVIVANRQYAFNTTP